MRLVLPVKDHELYSQKPLKIYWKPLLEYIFLAARKIQTIKLNLP